MSWLGPVLVALVSVVAIYVGYRIDRRKIREAEHNALLEFGHLNYKYYDLPWAKLFQRSCGQRFSIYSYFGKCELMRDHIGIPHAAERGMEWVRFTNQGTTWITGAGDKNQRPPEIIIKRR